MMAAREDARARIAARMARDPRRGRPVALTDPAVGAWTETDETALREAVAAKHAAVERCWSAERALREALADGRRDLLAVRRLVVELEAAWGQLGARGFEASYYAQRKVGE